MIRPNQVKVARGEKKGRRGAQESPGRNGRHAFHQSRPKREGGEAIAIVEEGVKDYVPDCAILYGVVRMVLLVLQEVVTTAHKHCIVGKVP